MSEEIKIKKEAGEIYVWTCPICGKTIRSLYPETLMIDSERHLQRHKKMGGKNE